MASAVVAHSVFSVMAWLVLPGIFMLGQFLLKYLYSIRQMNQHILSSLLDCAIGFSLYYTGRFKSNGVKIAAGTLKFSRIKSIKSAD